jgi:hypothetical protein
MHIIVIAWLFVTFTMALTMRSALAGIVLFCLLGLAPVALLVAVSLHRLRARRARAAMSSPSVREQQVHTGNDTDAERDQ